MKTFFREILITAVLALVIFLLLKITLGSFIIAGISMEPSFQDGQRLLVNKVVYRLHEPERGDVIVFQPPGNRQGDYIKRIIALPNDTIEVKKNTVLVNGSQLDELYIKRPPTYTIEQQKIPENSYFVLGDNRNNSNDSHNGWLVPRQNIVGKAWISIWPPEEWGIIPHPPLQEQLVGTINNFLAECPFIYNR